MKSGKIAKALKAYEYLTLRAKDAKPFTVADVTAATGWSDSTVRTYFSKQFQGLVEKTGDKYRVKRDFTRMSKEEFQRHVTQKRAVYTEYQRKRYSEIITFEFLLPLTREGQLRRALDDLFFTDTIQRRLAEIGIERLERIVTRDAGEIQKAYLEKVCRIVSDKFGGYSISHVSGRFRAAGLLSRREAGDLLADDRNYLIDETTAVVRFIVPCGTTEVLYGHSFEQIQAAISADGPSVADALAAEITLIRGLFFQLFVEAVVRTVRGEDLIWLLENGPTRRLYAWEAQKD